MKRPYVLLTTITLVLLGSLAAFGMVCETPPFINQALEPNIMILFDTSGSMANAIWIDGYDRGVDHTTWRLPVTGDEVIFAPEAEDKIGEEVIISCAPDHNFVWYRSDWKKVRLQYTRADTNRVERCCGVEYFFEKSDTDGYFYFDRGDGRVGTFIDKVDYDPDNPMHIKIFLPYATYSRDPDPPDPERMLDGNGHLKTDYKTWYDHDYLNWLFYESTPADRAALKQQHDDPDQRDLLTRMSVAKKVVKDLVDTTEAVRFGFMRFRGERGGNVRAPCGEPKEDILKEIDRVWPSGKTPLTEALEDAWLYFKGEFDYDGDGVPENPSPVEHWCQKNFVIVVTDGLPTFDSDHLEFLKSDWDGDTDGGNEDNRYYYRGSDYLDDVAYYIYENDCLDLQEKQNIYTFTIGFTIHSQLLKDAAFNGNGLAGLQDQWDDPASPHYRRYFYTADDYAELQQALQATINEIINKVASGTAVAVQSTQTEGKKRLLRAKFVPEGWKGYLEAFKLPYKKCNQPLWEAGFTLRNRGHGDRNIFTAMDEENGAGVTMTKKVSFTEANSTAEDADGQKLSDLLGAADDAEAKKIIRYIRGSGEDGYRERNGWKLGDIAYSSPVIFDTTVYVGANDGMLHAFDINTGEEKWAFVPNNLLPKLKDLALVDYCHEYFVDLSPKVAEIFAGGVHRKVLVGGERGGGNCFFGLDITDPSAAGMKPLWQFSNEYLGESFSVPTVERCWLNDQERWVVFVGSGRDNKDTKGYLVAIDALTGEMIGDELCLTGSPENMLPSIKVIDWDLDGYADRVFVGCMQEKLFLVEIDQKFADPSRWKSSHILSTDPGQPITVPTSLSLYREDGQDHVMAYFGTGKYYTEADRIPPFEVQSFYAVKDNAVKVGKGGLANQTDAFTCEPIQGGFGWYMDLVEGPGERVLSSSLVIGGYVFFTTFQPSDDPCDAGGIARLYCVNYDNGCVPAEPVFDANGDGIVDENDKIGGTVPRHIEIGYGVLSDIVFNPSESSVVIQTSDTTIHQFKVDLAGNRLTIHSWREVID
jgi:type IV pilus assembly protein PilY1